VRKNGKGKQTKSLSILANPSSTHSSPSTLFVTSTPKTTEIKPLISDLQSLYDQNKTIIEENEKKMVNCSITKLLDYYIHQNKELTKQQTTLLQQSQQSVSSTLILKK
jgi:hypothetical protein